MAKTLSAMPKKSKYSSLEYVSEFLVRFVVPDFQNCPQNVLDEATDIILNSTKNDTKILEEISNRDPYKTRYHYAPKRGSRHPNYGFYAEDLIAIVDSFLTQKVDGIYIRDLTSRQTTTLVDGVPETASVLAESMTAASVTAINSFVATIEPYIIKALYSRKDTVLTEDDIENLKKIIDSFSGSVSLKSSGVADTQAVAWCFFSRICGLFSTNFLGAMSIAYDVYSSSTTTKIEFDEVIDATNYMDFLTKCRLADNANALFDRLSEFVLSADKSWITIQADDPITGSKGGFIVDSDYDEAFFKKCLEVFSNEYVRKAHDDVEFTVNLGLLAEYINKKVKYLIINSEEVSQKYRTIFTMVNFKKSTLKLGSKETLISEEVVAPYELKSWLEKNASMEDFIDEVYSIIERYTEDWSSPLLQNFELTECLVNGRHLIIGMNHRPIDRSVYEVLKFNSSKRGSDGRNTICYFDRSLVNKETMESNLQKFLCSTSSSNGYGDEASPRTGKRAYKRFMSYNSTVPSIGGTESADGGYGVMINGIEKSALLSDARIHGMYFTYELSKIGANLKVIVSLHCELYTIKPPVLGDDNLAFGVTNQRRAVSGDVFRAVPVMEDSAIVDIIFSFPTRNAIPASNSDLRNLYLSKFDEIEEISVNNRVYKPFHQSKATMPNEATSYADFCNPKRAIAKVKAEIIKFILPSGVPVTDLLKSTPLPYKVKLPAYITKEFIIPDRQTTEYCKRYFDNAKSYKGALIKKGVYGLQVNKLSGNEAKELAEKSKFNASQFYKLKITLDSRKQLSTIKKPEFSSPSAIFGDFALNYDNGLVSDAVSTKSVVIIKDGSVVDPKDLFIGKRPIKFKDDGLSTPMALALSDLCSTISNYIVVHEPSFISLFEQFITTTSEKDFVKNMSELSDILEESYKDEQTLTSLGYSCSITIGELLNDLKAFREDSKKYAVGLTGADGKIVESIVYLNKEEMLAKTTNIKTGEYVIERKKDLVEACEKLLKDLGHEGISQFTSFNMAPPTPVSSCYLPKWRDYFKEVNYYINMPTIVDDVFLPDLSDFIEDENVLSFIKSSFKSLINAKVDFK